MTRLLSLLAGTCVTALLLGATVWLQEASDRDARRPAAEMAAVAASPEMGAAISRIDTDKERIVRDWIALASVPAPSGHEEARADHVEAAMKEMGLEGVRRDGAGNVIGILPGQDRKAKPVAFMAHMDTVARPGDDAAIVREDDVLRGAGVRDDSSGLAALLAATRVAVESGVVPPTDVMVVASVEEEVGLNGSRAFLEAEGERVGAFVAVDGYLGQVSYAATSIFWSKMHFRAPGAHTLRSHERPSATEAVARAVQKIYALDLPRSPEERETWLNVGMLGGGDVPNAQARDAWFTVDLRSNDPEIAVGMEEKILEICRKAAREVGVTFEQEILQHMEGGHIPGHAHSALVQAARAALDHAGWSEIRLTPRGTADHNVAILMGIPAVAIGATTGEGAHTPQESADIEPLFTGVRQILLMMAAPLY